jgi:TonB family protein
MQPLSVPTTCGVYTKCLHRQYVTIALILLALLTAATAAFIFPLLRPVPPPPTVPRHLESESAYVHEPFRPVFPGKPVGQPLRGPIRVSPPIAGSYVLHTVNPVLPSGTTRHLTGEVIVDVVVDREGHIESAKVVSGHPLLYAAALDAVCQWRFRSYLLNDQAIEYETTVSLVFR